MPSGCIWAPDIAVWVEDVPAAGVTLSEGLCCLLSESLR